MKRWNITAKLGNMKKAVEWTVYPPSKNGDYLIIQSDHRICQFDPTTGQGKLSRHCATHAGFIHLLPQLGATEIVVPQDIIDAAKAAQPQPGEKSGVLVIG